MLTPGVPLPLLITDAECRPRKLRVLPTLGSSSQLLPRRTYTWRGISCRRAEKQQRQLEALQQLHAATPSSPANSSGSDYAAGCPTPTALQPQAQQAVATPCNSEMAGGSREGDRDWAALTTWLRMVRTRMHPSFFPVSSHLSLPLEAVI